MSAVDRVLRFFENVLCLNGGEYEGKPFKVLDWQAFVLGNIFGWKGPDGFRRFRMAFIETGKGSGKSPLAAGIGLYCLTADKEARAEVYAAASKKDQAMVLFRDAVAMVKLSPELRRRLDFSGGEGREWNIAYLAKGGFFRPISSDDGQSGPRPHCVLLDEIHEHKDANMVEMMRAGTKGRKQALIFMITNSGSNRTGVCYQYHEYGVRVANGDLEDDAFFSYICALDEDEDPFKSEECWAKPNPSLGITFQKKYLEEQVTQARGMPAKEAVVRRLNFCEWTDAESMWIDRDLYEKCEREFNEEDLIGLPFAMGLDLSAKRDLTALGVSWRHPSGKTYRTAYYWTPKDTLEERERQDRVPYQMWVDKGYLNAVPGRIIDKDYVARFVMDFVAKHNTRDNCLGLAFDQAQIEDFMRSCDNVGLTTWLYEGDDKLPGDGLKMVRHGQGYSGYNSKHTLWMTRSINTLEESVVNGTSIFQANPVLRWNNASAVVEQDEAGNRKWNKKKATGRIDGIVAVSMSAGLVGSPEPENVLGEDYDITVW